MLHLSRHYAHTEDKPKRDNVIAKTAFEIGSCAKPKTPWLADYAFIGGMKWKPFMDSDFNWRYLEWNVMSNNIIDCIEFTLKKKNLKDMRNAREVGIFDVSTKQLYVDVNTRKIVVIRKCGFVWQTVGYLNPDDPLHRIQVTFEPNAKPLSDLL
uniref:Uncharacterized protein n=1 Tax=viral metagenome TaxID=1070528 RepID=A0A6C0CN93_9ZZZZ